MNYSKLRQLAYESRLTYEEIASRSGVTRPTVRNFLNGADAKISTVEAVARTLGTTVSYLVDEAASPVVTTHGDNSPASGTGDVTQNNGEAAHLREIIAEKDALIAEKERTIQLLRKLANLE